MCFLLLNYGKRKAPLGSCEQLTKHIDLRDSRDLDTRNSIL